MALPTLRQLTYLTSLVEIKHFGRAADHCFVTQSTLSAGIQDLESLLAVSLFERSNRKVMPTALGIEMALRAQEILSLSADLVELARSEANPLSGQIRMGIIPSISPFLLPKALPLLRQHLPKLELILIEDQSDSLLKQLNAGDIDVAVLALPFDIKGFNHRIFGKERFWVALPKHHALASQTAIKPEQLSSQELLLLSEGHCLREHALSACNLPSTRQRTSLQGTSLYTLIEMVAGGLGVTLIPEMALNSDMMVRADICMKPLDSNNGDVTRELGLVWRKSYQRRETLDLIAEHFSSSLK